MMYRENTRKIPVWGKIREHIKALEKAWYTDRQSQFNTNTVSTWLCMFWLVYRRVNIQFLFWNNSVHISQRARAESPPVILCLHTVHMIDGPCRGWPVKHGQKQSITQNRIAFSCTDEYSAGIFWPILYVRSFPWTKGCYCFVYVTLFLADEFSNQKATCS